MCVGEGEGGGGPLPELLDSCGEKTARERGCLCFEVLLWLLC